MWWQTSDCTSLRNLREAERGGSRAHGLGDVEMSSFGFSSVEPGPPREVCGPGRGFADTLLLPGVGAAAVCRWLCRAVAPRHAVAAFVVDPQRLLAQLRASPSPRGQEGLRRLLRVSCSAVGFFFSFFPRDVFTVQLSAGPGLDLSAVTRTRHIEMVFLFSAVHF